MPRYTFIWEPKYVAFVVNSGSAEEEPDILSESGSKKKPKRLKSVPEVDSCDSSDAEEETNSKKKRKARSVPVDALSDTEEETGAKNSKKKQASKKKGKTIQVSSDLSDAEEEAKNTKKKKDSKKKTETATKKKGNVGTVGSSEFSDTEDENNNKKKTSSKKKKKSDIVDVGSSDFSASEDESDKKKKASKTSASKKGSKVAQVRSSEQEQSAEVAGEKKENSTKQKETKKKSSDVPANSTEPTVSESEEKKKVKLNTSNEGAHKGWLKSLFKGAPNSPAPQERDIVTKEKERPVSPTVEKPASGKTTEGATKTAPSKVEPSNKVDKNNQNAVRDDDEESIEARDEKEGREQTSEVRDGETRPRPASPAGKLLAKVVGGIARVASGEARENSNTTENATANRQIRENDAPGEQNQQSGRTKPRIVAGAEKKQSQFTPIRYVHSEEEEDVEDEGLEVELANREKKPIKSNNPERQPVKKNNHRAEFQRPKQEEQQENLSHSVPIPKKEKKAPKRMKLFNRFKQNKQPLTENMSKDTAAQSESVPEPTPMENKRVSRMPSPVKSVRTREPTNLAYSKHGYSNLKSQPDSRSQGSSVVNVDDGGSIQDRSLSDRSNKSQSSSFVVTATVFKQHADTPTGITLKRGHNGNFFIARIDENGLFANTALKVGDEVLTINNISAQGPNLKEIIPMLRKSVGPLTILVKYNADASRTAPRNRRTGGTASHTPRSRRSNRVEMMDGENSLMTRSRKSGSQNSDRRRRRRAYFSDKHTVSTGTTGTSNPYSTASLLQEEEEQEEKEDNPWVDLCGC